MRSSTQSIYRVLQGPTRDDTSHLDSIEGPARNDTIHSWCHSNIMLDHSLDFTVILNTSLEV